MNWKFFRKPGLLLAGVLLAMPGSSAFAKECLFDPAARNVTLSLRSSGATAGPGLLGASTRFDIDNDPFWSSPATADSFSRAHVATLRFPGGEVADNYDWETHRLERPDAFPGEAKTDAEREQRTDYREFVAAASRMGIHDLFFVVNVDGAVRANGSLQQSRIDAYAAKAAKWVKAVNGNGTRVKYWEIGNEIATGSYPLTVSEYAVILKAYAKAMRAVDPNIKIGASGPSDLEAGGKPSKLPPQVLSDIRTGKVSPKSLCDRSEKHACKARLQKEAEATGTKAEAWWPELARQAGDSFDFAVIHRYQRAAWPKPGDKELSRTTKLRELRQWLTQAKGKDVPIAITEWNTPSEKKIGHFSEMDHLVDMAALVGSAAVGGVDFAHYWPLRNKIDKGGVNKPLLTRDSQLAPSGQLFQLIGDSLPGSQVGEAIIARDVYALSMQAANGQKAVMVANRGSVPVRLDVRPAPNLFREPVHVSRLLEGGDDDIVLEGCEIGAGNVSSGWLAPARSVSVFKY